MCETQFNVYTSCAEVGSKLGYDSTGVSRETVRRFVRLTNLIPELMDMVDEKKIAFNPAVELSYLTREEPQPSGQSDVPTEQQQRYNID